MKNFRRVSLEIAQMNLFLWLSLDVNDQIE